MLKNLQQLGIILFCLWHMFAVAIYAVPWDAKDRIALWSNTHLLPVVSPYMLWTSQWQQWSLFAPDPKSAYSLFRLEIADGTQWKTIASLTPDDFTFLDRCDELKVIRRLEETDRNWKPVRENYLQHACQKFRLPPGTLIQLTARSTHLPFTRARLQSWADFEPDWFDWQVAYTHCALIPD